MEITGIPEKAKDYFLSLVKSDFDGNSGMALKYLCDLHTGLFPTGTEALEAQIDALAGDIMDINVRLNLIDQSKKEEGIKMIGGNVLPRGEGK